MVHALRQLGVEAYGLDASSYALSKAPAGVASYLKHGLADDLPFADNEFDLVIALDIMEHISEKELPTVCSEIMRVTSNKAVFCIPLTVEPTATHDKTHQTLKSREWWNELLAKYAVIEDNASCLDRSIWWFNIPHRVFVVRKNEAVV
jgi:ubiquinone/menaquinone biosynthesis C-methylase UbiE